MIIITGKQMEYLSSSLVRASTQRMIVHLRDDFREQRLARDVETGGLEVFVQKGIADAEAYGIVFEDEIERYLECALLLGLDYGSKLEWACEIFHREDLDGQAKMNAISDYLIFSTEEPPL